MDKISSLPDEVLVKAVSTSLLSKRREVLWMWLPKLEYRCSDFSVPQGQMLREFIDLNLPLHKALESLRLKFSHGAIGGIKPKYITLWVSIAVLLCVRELSLKLFSFANSQTKLPCNLYVSKSLVILKLEDDIFVSVHRMVCLPSLKTLSLRRVTYSCENSLHQLLSKCPVLEDLFVERDKIDNLEKLIVMVKSLQRLTLKMCSPCYLDGIMINTPLKYLEVTDHRLESDSEDENDSDSPIFSYSFEDMPKLEEAGFVLTFQNIKRYFGSITSVTRLSLCLGVYIEPALYSEGIVFNHLKHLKICSCDSSWSILLARLLKDSPNLREIEAYLIDYHPDRRVEFPNKWDSALNSVPRCLLSSVETFKWTEMYALQNQMDTATILFAPSYAADTVDVMIQELSLSSRGSKTCQLIFG
ncbi:hypothetical protein CARUB_v10010919mg [Capsella rubella]|uniref:FBD domain-containing protein n=1 Tax=Capsella rubella TaxID=81985 RepID=R0GMW2_9BRAS|nr:hypothetical protein CARUB_v10010919mg [Capsella rubella]